MEPTKIYLDMDGVLADFDNGLRELLNVTPKPQGHQTQAFQNEMWTKMAEYQHFYRDMKPIAGAIEGFEALWNKYVNKVEILSGIPKPHRNITFASEDKLSWVRKYLNEEITVNLVYRAEKKNFCKDSSCILIDDYESNIKEWNAAGGSGILFKSWDEMDL